MESNTPHTIHPDLPRSIAIIGCGVIGSGWAARFRLCGVDARVYDPADSTAGMLQRTFDHARTAWQDLGLLPDRPGRLQAFDTLAQAVDGAELIHECVPERLELKYQVLDEIEQHAGESALITSSTSGFRPGQLAEQLERPEQFLVAHPFQPVYLLPLVELVPGPQSSEAAMQRAALWYRSAGMKPLRLRKEIDAFIADRLLESMWREALWLVRDGVATTEEIDDAVRYGFGLRWAQMGMFEQYRIAGGDGGMQHFISQFGEALNWPWSRLTDTPELDQPLIDKICDQSEQQSGHLSITELERIRDANLVAILRALEGREWGAGQSLAEFRRQQETKDCT